MAVQRYRYQRTGPNVSLAMLERLVGAGVVVAAYSGADTLDLDWETTLIADLTEYMTSQGYALIAGPGVTGTPAGATLFALKAGSTITGDFVFSGGATVTGLPMPTDPTDAATLEYVQAYVLARDPKDSCRLATNAALVGNGWISAGSQAGKTLTSPDELVTNNDFDGVTAVLGDRVLVNSEAGAARSNHGIYVVTQLADTVVPTVLTRATDFDVNAEVSQGAYFMVTEGSAWAETAWQLITPDPINVDVTELIFARSPGSGVYTAGAGLELTGNQFDVELDTAAPSTGAGSGGGSSGLEFDAAGVGGTLRVAVTDTAGMRRGAAGLEVAVDATSVLFNGSGQLTGRSKSALGFSAGTITSTTTTRYLLPGGGYSGTAPTTTDYRIVFPRAGRVRRMYVFQGNAAGNGQPVVYTLLLNGTPTALAVSVASNVQQGNNTADTVAVAQGDRGHVQVTKAGSIGTAVDAVEVWIEYEADAT